MDYEMITLQVKGILLSRTHEPGGNHVQSLNTNE